MGTDRDQFEFVDAPGGQCVRIRFHGSFQGHETRWDCELATLSHYCMQDGHDAGDALRPFIEIGAESTHGRRLRVGLDVAAIDRPTVAKTVIMVRNYRRLRRGRIEFGDPVECSGR